MEHRSSTNRESEKEKIARIITELRSTFSLSILLQVSKMKRSTYYYTISKEDKDFKNDKIMNEIIRIFYEHKERYGYRRVTLELMNQGYNINHKKVLRLMNRMGLHAKKRSRRKYSSYKGKVGRVADNLIARNFHSDLPNKKWYTDVTEFSIPDGKLYVSPIIDGYNGEIISVDISTSPDLKQSHRMLDKAINKYEFFEDLIIHSDQGFQYQHFSYRKKLKKHNIRQSMSRKGNSIDNGLMESFFATLKTEMFYGQEKKFKNIKELEIAIYEYINYYNNKRIRAKLKGLSPVQYRIQSLSPI